MHDVYRVFGIVMVRGMMIMLSRDPLVQFSFAFLSNNLYILVSSLNILLFDADGEQ